MGFSNASIKVINELKSCLEANGSNTTSIFVARNTHSERYNSVNYQWNTNSEIFPLAYIVPQTTKDVQNAVRCGKASNVRMFPKSGGLSYEKYSFGDSDSVVVDLANLSEIRVNKADKTAQVGAGALLSKIYFTLWTNGKFGFPSASCTNVGIGGPALGGGYGFWSKRYGMTSDNVIGMDFVDPQGNFLKVNRTSNPDLFWALRGGGLGNFGIVTNFEFKIFDAASLNVRQIVLKFCVNLFEQIFSGFQTLVYEHRNGNPYIGMKITPQHITVKIIDTDLSDADIRKIVDRFPPQMLKPVSVKSMDFFELTLENSTPETKTPEDLLKVSRMSTSKHGYRAKSYFSSKILNYQEIAQLKPSLSSVPSGIFLQFGSFGGVVNQIPKNETSFVHRDSLYLIQVGISPSDELQQRIWLREFNNVARVLDNGESYQNYVDGELKNDFLQRYYGDNVRRLIEIKRQIDPDNYFAYEQSIPLRKP
ncbi:Berberine bridge enzyme-like 21 [Pseudolycoriella hygida]|uniref:Berberine bridge enzyme-like 21 n=1 Tax=Pseudolycoriella hygida TaxID=35572 RepID=A0A9Q0NAQ6_9DIPT|nr:Berberine bridge enzyme-like 21 [Pseudolycoriella hygida]